MVVAVDLDETDRPELAFLDDPVLRVNQVRRAAALHPHLDDALVFPCGREHGLRFDDVDADRFLDPDVETGFDRLDHRKGMPVIGRIDDHQVEVTLFEQGAVIGIDPRPLLRELPGRDEIGGVRHHLLVDVAERHDFDRRDLDEAQEVGLAVPAAADETDPLLHVAELAGVGRKT